MAHYVIFGLLTDKSPDIFAPAMIPVAAGKYKAKTEINDSPFLQSGKKLSVNVDSTKTHDARFEFHTINLLLENPVMPLAL